MNVASSFSAISRAFLSVGSFATQEILTDILGRLSIHNGMSVEEIQNQVEFSLMSERYFSVAKSYILYRQKHTEDREVRDKLQFLVDYCNASNSASGSKYDANANVENKNIATLIGELPKSNFIRLNRRLLVDRLKDLYGKEISDKYLNLLNSHFIYKNDETSLANYCASITMYPWLIGGTLSIGGNSKKPTNLKSFCGGFVNMVFMVSSMLSGACATPEFLMYMNYFIGKEYGVDYYKNVDKVVDLSIRQRTLDKVITDSFEQIVYSINQPTGARNFQAVFWNISYYDKYYFNSLFENFVFPDGSRPDWDSLNWLQKRFMKWFNVERMKTVLTFPVETMALLTDGGDDFMDKEYADFTAQMWADGHSFFCYLSDSPDSLSSCCRLRNSLKDLDNADEAHNHTTHQYSMGTASVSTGSKSVMSMNLPRLIQNATRKYFKSTGWLLEDGKNIKEQGLKYDKEKLYEYIRNEVRELTERVHKYQTAFNETIKDFLEAKMLDVYDAGFIDMKKQYLTVGVNGITDAAEFLGIQVSVNDEYKEFVNNILETINIANRKDKTRECMFNTEFVPAENLAAKNYKWDKKDGYWVSPNRNLYSSYFYNPEDDSVNVLQKTVLHGKDFVKYLDGGSAYHCNLQEHLTQPQYRQFMKAAAKNGCNYFTFNVKNTVCNECGYISKHTLDVCPHCGSKDLDYLTRVIGYLKRISSFSEPRQEEADKRVYM